MKSLLFLLAIGLASSDKLDRTYLPPPGSKYAGGSPGSIDVPLEFPKQSYLTTRPPLTPGDFQATVGIDRGIGIQDQDRPGNPPFNNFQNSHKAPITTTSYAFTQTTTFPPSEGLETTIGPIGQEYLGDGSFGDQQTGFGNYPQNYDQQLNIQGPAFGQPGQIVSQRPGLLPSQGTTIQPGFPSQLGQSFDNRPGYQQPQDMSQYQQSFGPSSTVSPINSISQTPGFVSQAPYGQNQGSNQYLGVQPPQQSFGQQGSFSEIGQGVSPSYQPGTASQYGEDINNVQGSFPASNTPQQLGDGRKTQYNGQQVPSTTARPQGIHSNYQPGIRPQYDQNVGQDITGTGSNIGQQLVGQQPSFGQPGLLPTTGAPVLPGYQPGPSTPYGQNIEQTRLGQNIAQQSGSQRLTPEQTGNLPSTVRPQSFPGYQPGTPNQFGDNVSPGMIRPGTNKQKQGGQRPGLTQEGISSSTLSPQGVYQSGSTPQYGENIVQGVTAPGVSIGQQSGGQRPGINQQRIESPSSSPQGYQPGTSQYGGDLDNIQGIQGSSLPGQQIYSQPGSNIQQAQPQFNQNQYQPSQRPKPEDQTSRGDGQNIYRPDGTVTPSTPPGYNQPAFPSTTPGSLPSYSTTVPGNVSPTAPGYNQGSVFSTGVQRPQRPQADADRNAVILNYENVLTPEGYFYTFDTSNGIHADESGTAVDGVKAQGSYSYTGDDGKFYEVVYSADENGFQPRGDHLPTAPPIPEAIKKVIEQAEKDKAAGILHDGSYDEGKYGHKKYQGMMRRYRPNANAVANGVDIPDEYDSKFIKDNKKNLESQGGNRRPVDTTEDIINENGYDDELNGNEDQQAGIENVKGNGKRPDGRIPGRLPSNLPNKDLYKNTNGERFTEEINPQSTGSISETRKPYPIGNEEYYTRRSGIPGREGNRPYLPKDKYDESQDYGLLEGTEDPRVPGQNYNIGNRFPSTPGTSKDETVRPSQTPGSLVQETVTGRPKGTKLPIAPGSKYSETYDEESNYDDRTSQMKRPNQIFNNQNVDSADGSEDYYRPNGEVKRPGISGSRFNDNQKLNGETGRPGQPRRPDGTIQTYDDRELGQPGQPGQSRQPVEFRQPGKTNQFDTPIQPGDNRRPGEPSQFGKPNQFDTAIQPWDYRRPGESSQPGKPNQFNTALQPGDYSRPGESSQPGKPNQFNTALQPGDYSRPGESNQSGKPNQFDTSIQTGGNRRPGQLSQPGKPNQFDTARQPGDYRRPGEPGLTSSEKNISGNRGDTPKDITFEEKYLRQPSYDEQVNTGSKYISQRPTEPSGYQYIPPQNKFELDKKPFSTQMTENQDVSTTIRPVTQYNTNKDTTPRPFITPNVFDNDDHYKDGEKQSFPFRKPGKVTSSPMTTQNGYEATDNMEYDDKGFDQEIGDDMITPTRRPGQPGITTIGSTRRPYSQTQQTTARPQYNKDYLPGGQRSQTQPGSKGDYTEDYDSEGPLRPGKVNYNGLRPTSKTPGYTYTSTTPMPSTYPGQYETSRPGFNQRPGTQYTTSGPTATSSVPNDDTVFGSVTRRPVAPGRPAYGDRTSFPSSTTIRPTTSGTYSGLGNDYDRTSAPGSVTIRPTSRLPAGRPGRPGRPITDYTDRTAETGSVTRRPGISGTSPVTRRPTPGSADNTVYTQPEPTRQSSGLSGRPGYSDRPTTAITTRPETNSITGRPVFSTTYRPSSLFTDVTQKPIITVDGYGRPITEQPDGRIPSTTYRPESSSSVPVQDNYQTGPTPAQVDKQGVNFKPQFGGQEFVPGQIPFEGQRPNDGQVQIGGSYPGLYPSSTTEKIIGEDFSGPKQAQKFDPKTGYYY